MRERRGSPAATAAFRRLMHMFVLWRKRGVPDWQIDAFIREKLLADLAKDGAKRLEPSRN